MINVYAMWVRSEREEKRDGDPYHHQEVLNKMLKSFPDIYAWNLCVCDDSYENDKTKIIHINLIWLSNMKNYLCTKTHTHTYPPPLSKKVKWKNFCKGCRWI